MMKLKNTWGSSGVLLGLSLLFACGGDDMPTETLRPVRYTQVFSTGAGRARAFSGVARARVESRLSFRVAGSIQRIPVEVGDEVRAGQLLAQPTRQVIRIVLAGEFLVGETQPQRFAEPALPKLDGSIVLGRTVLHFDDARRWRGHGSSELAASRWMTRTYSAAKKKMQLAM